MAKIETLDERIKTLSAHWRLYAPEGEGPFALMIQMHGCGGCHAFQDDYARAAVAEGAAALVVDSYPHRNISPAKAVGMVCTGLKLWGRERAGDLYAAFAWARSQPTIDRARIFASGWSHGGWSVLDALAVASPRERERWTGLVDLPDEPLEGLAGAFVFYPYCGAASVARARGLRFSAPVHAIVAGADGVVGGRKLETALRALPKPGATLQWTFFDGASHAFDEPDTGDPRFRFNPDLAAKSRRLWLAMLKGQYIE
jgi:dienelactone hydrolase